MCSKGEKNGRTGIFNSINIVDELLILTKEARMEEAPNSVLEFWQWISPVGIFGIFMCFASTTTLLPGYQMLSTIWLFAVLLLMMSFVSSQTLCSILSWG